jgi:nitrogen fixation protein NifU and related proteins
MNPVVGLDLVRTKMIREMTIEDGKVRVVVDLPADHQFANNIRHEIIDKIEPLWDVHEVQVEFSE